jgi:hypothetical protein
MSGNVKVVKNKVPIFQLLFLAALYPFMFPSLFSLLTKCINNTRSAIINIHSLADIKLLFIMGV